MENTQKARSSRKAQVDNYLDARDVILRHAGAAVAPQFMWLEVCENPRGGSDALDYEIHASNDANRVPPFAIEVYRRGQLESYESRGDVIYERAMMPETLRQRIVQSQLACKLIDRAEAAARTPALA